jgi:hypothetical protein
MDLRPGSTDVALFPPRDDTWRGVSWCMSQDGTVKPCDVAHSLLTPHVCPNKVKQAEAEQAAAGAGAAAGGKKKGGETYTHFRRLLQGCLRGSKL